MTDIMGPSTNNFCQVKKPILVIYTTLCTLPIEAAFPTKGQQHFPCDILRIHKNNIHHPLGLKIQF